MEVLFEALYKLGEGGREEGWEEGETGCLEKEIGEERNEKREKHV